MEFSSKHIDYLSRTYLDEVSEGRAAQLGPEDLFIPPKSSLTLIHLSGLNRFWEPSQRKDDTTEQHRYRMEDVLVGCHGAKVPLIFLVRGLSSSPEIDIDIGTLEPYYRSARRYEPDASINFVNQSLPGHYPGIQATRRDTESVDLITKQIGTSKFYGMVTGLPTVKVTDEVEDPTQLDRLIRTMYGSDWGYMVIAQPVPDELITSLTHAALNEMRIISNAEQTKSTWAPLAKAYHDMLEITRKEYEEGKAKGLWAVTACYFSAAEMSFCKLGAAIRAYLGGEKSTPDPIRTFELPLLSAITPKLGQIIAKPDASPGKFEYPFRFQTLHTSGRLATLIHLPRLEVPGFTVRESCRFDVVSPQEAERRSIEVGEVLHYGRAIGSKYQAPVDSFQKHALIVGVTGSGKTNTVFHLLAQFWQAGIPFLVLEPAKSEYRAMVTHNKLGPDINIFTLGEERVSPLRLNPFEVEAGVSVSTHIDLLKSVFNASFGMWNPLPQVLERCIHLIYRDRGWAPARNTNVRLEPQGTASPEAYPTLTDLYEKIDEVVRGLGYEERVESDIRAALLTRINSLRIGSKGIMLDTRHSMPIEELLAKPTIIELEQIGDDAEKAFLMGLLLTRIYEYLRGRGSTEGTGLRHIVVIEEAHRLLANVPPRASMEESDIKGKAVETFTSMLSEVRAYGEGFIVAEQIPVKLAIDVIKNTNLKIVHRTVAGEDRRLLAETMNMSQRQCDMLSVFRMGEAAVFVEGDDKPVMVKVPYAKIEVPAGMKTKAGSDEVVAQHMKPFRNRPDFVRLYTPFDACLQVCQGALLYCDEAKELVATRDFQERFAALVLSAVLQGISIREEYGNLLQLMRSRLGQRALNVSAYSCVVLNALRWYFDYFGGRYNWSYDTTARLRELASGVLLDMLPAIDAGSPELAAGINEKMAEFQKLYRLSCRRLEDPFLGCFRICPTGECLFRYHNDMLLADRRLNRLFDENLEAARNTDSEVWPEVSALKLAISRLNGDNTPVEVQQAIGLCYGVMQLTYRPGMVESVREDAINRLLAYLIQPGEGNNQVSPEEALGK